jgi:hypothetical protein
MAGNTTSNSDPVVRALVHSNLMLEVLKDDFLPVGIHRDVTDFGDGNQIQIPTIGEMALFDLTEGQPTPTSAIDTGKIFLSITDHVGVAGYISDELKEDGYKAAAVESQIVPESLRAIKERFETDLLSTAISTTNGMVTLGDPNAVNGFDHRWIADGLNNTITLEDFIHAKLAFDKANVPDAGRIALVDPIVEASLNTLANLVNVSNNPQFEGMVTKGFARDRKFVRNIFGFDIYVSNRLPRIASESITSVSAPGAASITGGVNNIFMSIAGDTTKPFMGAMRRMPRVEGDRNVSERRDEFHTTARWGFAMQRGESLISIITSETDYVTA